MNKFIDKSAGFVHAILRKNRPGVADAVRFCPTGVPCWRCDGHMEYYYCEDGIYALRCDNGCPGVFLVRELNAHRAADEIAGTHVGDIPGGGVPGAEV